MSQIIIPFYFFLIPNFVSNRNTKFNKNIILFYARVLYHPLTSLGYQQLQTGRLFELYSKEKKR